jgi:hypothetical protein
MPPFAEHMLLHAHARTDASHTLIHSSMQHAVDVARASRDRHAMPCSAL